MSSRRPYGIHGVSTGFLLRPWRFYQICTAFLARPWFSWAIIYKTRCFSLSSSVYLSTSRLYVVLIIIMAEDMKNLLVLQQMLIVQQQQANDHATAVISLIRRRRRRARRRRCWVRPWLGDVRREQFGHFNRLMSELRHEDPASFQNFLGVSPEMFDELLTRLSPRITKQDTKYRKAIDPGTKLALGSHSTPPSFW